MPSSSRISSDSGVISPSYLLLDAEYLHQKYSAVVLDVILNQPVVLYTLGARKAYDLQSASGRKCWVCTILQKHVTDTIAAKPSGHLTASVILIKERRIACLPLVMFVDRICKYPTKSSHMRACPICPSLDVSLP
jgi:hypothetical protein